MLLLELETKDQIHMQRLIFISLLLYFTALTITAQNNPPSIYVDKQGVMKWTDTNKEASFFGVNYTVPFAHAYRAIGYLGKDHKEAIDKDIYHFARLGFNAYRIHIWDVEISDENGNLIENNHLDLLDYLISKLKERNIKIVLTAMTTFGDGYPEKNQKTDGFSYKYDKCDVHSNPEAIKAQEEYIYQLIRHQNPYTGKSYMDDPDIVGFEINNEPCHKESPAQTKEYINRMMAAIKKAGNKKPVFYNVSHNMEHIESYYATNTQGTTYQWYPIGLVAGRTRKGNFLPHVDNYNIPFSNVKGFANKAKLVYEYDPADITYSYMHPAMARSFRSAGFQWITQFAYDPIDMAWANTEYQTHFLNLAYTPQKAISMKIAAEVAYSTPRNQTYPKYPNDTIFGDFHVSYAQDLSELNSPEKFIYSNNTIALPVSPKNLKTIAGTGSSTLVKYEGTGAYFLDKLENGLWRLEVMPDAVQVNDPFAKPSLKKEVVTIMWNKWDMEISLPDLGDKFSVKGINDNNPYQSIATNSTISDLEPGVYILQSQNNTSSWDKNTQWNNIRLNEFVAPKAHADKYYVTHNAAKIIESDKPLNIEAQIAGPQFPDSVIIYTDKVSFWNEHNPYFKMERIQGYTYRTTIPAESLHEGKFKYNIIVFKNGKNFTFPSATETNPLDWDYTQYTYWESAVINGNNPVNIFTVTDEYSNMDSYTMPEWSRSHRQLVDNSSTEKPTLKFTFESNDESSRFFLQKYIKDDIVNRISRLKQTKEICLVAKNIPTSLSVGFITNKGYTYSARINDERQGIIKIPISQLRQGNTALLPHPYPVFLNKYFEPDTPIPFSLEDIEFLEIWFDGEKDKKAELEIGNIWLE